MRRSIWLLGSLAGGCEPNEDDGPTGGDTCAIVVQQAFPEEGATDVFYQTDVHFLLSSPDETATITITEVASGVSVPGTTTIEGTLVTWSGDQDLEPQESYVATLSFSCGDETRSWTTSNAGEPVSDPQDLVGNVYSIDLEEGHWVEPYNVGVLLGAFLADVEILVSPVDVGATITMRGALGDGTGEQDLCAVSIPFPPATFDNPSFTIETERLELPLPTATAAIDDLSLSGSFTPDGEAIAGVQMSGSVDTRALNPLIEGEGDDAFCQLLDGIVGVPCEECADGTGPFCVTILVDNLTAEGVGQSGLVERTQEQIEADPACATN